jgi:type IV fimbrial biogenesis protein FimT
MATNAQRGFTLLELLMSVLLASIILGLGVPSFIDFSRNSRMTANTNDLLASIHIARGEAVKRRAPVTVCSSANATGANPSCDAGSMNGWLVFADDNDGNGDGIPDGDGVVDPGEEIIQVHAGLPAGMNVNADGAYVSFASSGFTRDIPGLGNGASNVLICDVRGNEDLGGGNSAARVIVIAPTGRAQVFRDVARVGATLGGCP